MTGLIMKYGAYFIMVNIVNADATVLPVSQ